MPFLVIIEQQRESTTIRYRRKSSGSTGDFTHTYLLLLPSLDRRVGKQVEFILSVVQINPMTGSDYQV
jgi:hypothetical protein